MKLILRIRHHRPTGHATVWLINKDGPALSGLMNGNMPSEKADRLAEQLAEVVEVEVFEIGDEYADGETPESSVERQGHLFELEK